MSHKKLLPEVIEQCTQQCSIVCCLSVGVDCWCHWAGAWVQPRWHFGQMFQWLDQPSDFCLRNWPVHLLVLVSLQMECNSLFLMAQCCFVPRFFAVHIWTAEHLGCCSRSSMSWCPYKQTISKTHSHKDSTFQKSVKTKEPVCICVHNT